MQSFSPVTGHQNPQVSSASNYSKVPGGHHESPQSNGTVSQEISTWRRRIRFVRMLSRSISAFLNVVMFAFMTLVIAVFLSTRHDQAIGRSVWPKDPKTWPTVMLLVASLVTLTLSIFVLFYYCLCFKRAVESWKVIVVIYGIHISVWITVVYLYRWEKTLNDLWGWSCTDIAKKIQASGNSKVDFSKLCKIQEISWILSIIETALKVLFAIGYFALFRKTKEAEAKQRLAEGYGEGALGLLDVVL
ncbi:MAG: hypothetical protein M1839_004538 [Geoglossum umbratile]|nr:MAG: hypothetical protein M1839_004538 [Geoglossum umbratile]